MSAQDQVYLRDNGDRVELLVDPGLIHVVEMPYLQPARRVPKHGYLDPDRVARTFLRDGYARVREQPVARVLVDIAPDKVDQVKRAFFSKEEWGRRLSKKTFLATLDQPLSRREAWALLRYVRLRHARVLALDARIVSPPGGAKSHRQPLRAWLEAIAQDDGDLLDEVVFRDCRFHRDEQALLEAIVPRAPAVGFVGGLPRNLEAFNRVERFTLGCRAPDGLVPPDVFRATRDSDVDPVSLAIELGRAQLAPRKTADAMLSWLTAKPGRRLRSLSLSGCLLTTVNRLAESGLALERVRWQGRITGADLEALGQREFPFALSITPSPRLERGLAGKVLGTIAIVDSDAPVCPW